MRLALDAMGGDHAPAAAVEGALLFARESPPHHVVLVGDAPRVEEVLQRLGHRAPNLSVRHATQVVDMGDGAAASIRQKKDSSLRVCFELVERGEADAVVSAGHSGAVMAGALLVLGRMRLVERPAVAALFPALRGGGRCLLLDAGANVECKPSHLAQFAVMGEAYVRAVLHRPRPRVAILSNGEEPSKGTDLTRQALALLKRSALDFRGYVEGKDIFSGEVEVVVTDGFTGNVVLKTSEGTAMAVAGLIRTAVEKAGIGEKLGALLLTPTFAGLKKVVDYAEYGGAPLLGVDGVAIVAHGRSSPKAVKNALFAALANAQVHLKEEIAAALDRAAQWLPKRAGRKVEEAGE
ncbi:MAG TPA: phosphate acyltransferase PlsX [Myxococcales bacterium]|nr:phosphate acyltransferase PlsX [Myxococcales bacterium]